MRGNSHVRFGERGGETRRPQGRKVRPAPTLRTGNFLYVSLEHLLRLEAEVLQRRSELGKEQMLLELEAVRVTPRQLLGIEINPRWWPSRSWCCGSASCAGGCRRRAT